MEPSFGGWLKLSMSNIRSILQIRGEFELLLRLITREVGKVVNSLVQKDEGVWFQ